MRRLCLPFFLYFWVDIHGHTRRSCLPFFSIYGSIFVDTRGYCARLYFIIGSIFLLWCSRQIVPCWHTWLVFMPFFNALGGMISPAIFFYRSAVAVISAHEVAGDEVSVSPILKISLVSFSCWTLVLIIFRFSWTMGLLNLENIYIVSM